MSYMKGKKRQAENYTMLLKVIPDVTFTTITNVTYITLKMIHFLY